MINVLRDKGAQVGKWLKDSNESLMDGGSVVGVGDVDIGGADLWVFVGPSVPEGVDDGGEYDMNILHADAKFESMAAFQKFVI